MQKGWIITTFEGRRGLQQEARLTLRSATKLVREKAKQLGADKVMLTECQVEIWGQDDRPNAKKVKGREL